MKRILISLSIIGAVAAIAIGATTAFFSDTEQSTGNTFTAGAIDLKVDSTATYNSNPVQNSTWEATDLGASNKFFDFIDLKPGDEGENTISLQVINNDAWGKMTVTATTDNGATCTEPEIGLAADADCPTGTAIGTSEADGELRDNTHFSLWLDQGVTPGFQGKITLSNLTGDQGEGDNIWQPANEPLFYGAIPKGFTPTDYSSMWWYGNVSNGTIEMAGEVSNLWTALAATYTNTSTCITTPATCIGLTVDGRLVGGVTYYFGVAWQIPSSVGNEAQGDKFTADLKFDVVQHRNNPAQAF